MASMTRCRCVEDGKPGAAVIEHYAMRARDGVGLIIAEGTFLGPNTTAFTHAPVMFREDHAEAWRKVTDAVHREGGKIFFQPWHVGPSGSPGNAPSTGNVAEFERLDDIIGEYTNAVSLAKRAGFDGVELLAGGAYLIHQFMINFYNSRSDNYSYHPVQNRCRLGLEVIDAIIKAWGTSRRVGIKFSPSDDWANATQSYTELSETYEYFIHELMARDLAYIHVNRRGSDKEILRPRDPRPANMLLPPDWEPLHQFGPMIKKPESRTALTVSCEYEIEEAAGLVRDGKLDLVQLGRPFIFNPDLITRIRHGLPFATNNRGPAVYYTPNLENIDEGYNDWPFAEDLKN
ncbi:FMN-linked oxidoreductase [Cryphonectria parasitica EP155]|uniref:FMN-linked oxidoreductase n=1 Tax=Cryphonectria parasitica (strain ATCC 38755 / EP155) TaxID=660469 RepID=A0A9P4XWJ6_CRYP1|nr:FMN-linked oxidoreductase [Cryphonectria parasitica EP155]KAF3762218.1 FMN-linked oxidoreductase [Cryphonectria parasitica EP155]